jgi:molybdopterin/thiamine biosynthesis adenylyltransferase
VTDEQPSSQRLEDAEVERYSRQLLLPEIGEAGQLGLRRTSAVVVGCGGLGGPAALFLAAGGVGRVRLIDPDLVELDNLHRQVAFRSSDVGKPKAELLAQSLRLLNPLVSVEAVVAALDEESVGPVLAGADLVLECSDDPATKFLINQVCVHSRTALVVGGAIGFAGQLVVVAPEAACYRCLFNTVPPGAATSCRAAGVFGPLVGVVGALQALEGMKLALGLGRSSPEGRLLDFDALRSRWRELTFPIAPDCGLHRS